MNLLLDQIRLEPLVYFTDKVQGIVAIAISEGRQLIAIGSDYQDIIEILNIMASKVKYYFIRSTNQLKFSKDSSTLAQSSYESFDIVLLNIENGQQHKLKGHTREICGMIFIDNQQLATSSFDNTLKIWDYISLNLKSTIKLIGVSIDLQFWGETNILITNCMAKVTLYQLNQKKIIKQFYSLDVLSHYCQLDQQSGLILISGKQVKSKLFCLRNSKQIRKFTSKSQQATNAFFPRKGYCIISTLEEIIVLNYSTGAEEYRKKMHFHHQARIAVDNQCNYLAIAGLMSEELYLWKFV